MRSHSRALFAVAALFAFLLLAPLAHAAPKGVAAFFGNPPGGSSTLAGQFAPGSPHGIAVNTTGAGPADPGDIYVADTNNNRIQRFSVLGEFERLWGKDVIKADATVNTDLGNVAEICTAAADCKGGAIGSRGGEFSQPQGIAVDQASGDVYVVERQTGGGIRVQVFDGDGAFLRAFGAGVVSPGGVGNVPLNEQQTFTVAASGGTFKLSFNGQTTVALPFNGPATDPGTPGTIDSVQEALNDLTSVKPGGSVSVSDGPGDATGSTPYKVSFDGGTLADTDVPQITVDSSSLAVGAGRQLKCTGNPTSGVTLSYQWLSNGDPATGTGATTDTYTVDASDAGKAIQCQVTAVNSPSANTGSVTVSNPTIAAPSPSPAPPSAPFLIFAPSGTVAAGNNLTCNAGAWGGSPTSYTYKWMRNGTQVLETETKATTTDTYTLTASDVSSPAAYQCVVTASNPSGAVTKASANKASNPAPSPGAPFAGANTSLLVPFASTATTLTGGLAAEICTIATECKASVSGTKGGEFGGSIPTTSFDGGSGVAVVPTDGGSPLPNAGNVLVTDSSNRRVQEFTPAGAFVRAFGWDTIVDGSPSDPSSETGFQICTAAADCKVGAAEGAEAGRFGDESPNRVAVDSSGAIYTVENRRNFRLQKFTPLGSDLSASILNPNVGGFGPALPLSGTATVTPLTEARQSTPIDVAVGADDHVFVLKSYPQGLGTPTTLIFNERRVVELDSAGAYVETHAARAGMPGGAYFALNADSEEIYISTGSPPVGGGNGVYILGASAAPTVSLGVSAISTHTAQLNGLVDPGGPDTPIGIRTKYHFEFRKVGAPSWTALSADKDIGNGFATVPVTATLGDLEANTAYEAKLVASKPFSGVASIETTPEVFVTPSSQPEIDAAYVTEREANMATLNARINPNGQATTYRFEYGPTAAYGTTVPVPDGDAGSATASQIFSEAIAGLSPETTYHFRVVATNGSGTIKSTDRTFTTTTAVQPPTERGYELVSPPDKVGGSGLGPWYAGVGAHSNVGIGAIEGDRFSPLAYYGASFVDGGFSYGTDASLAERTPNGWVNKPAFNRRGGVDHGEFAVVPAMLAASNDLSLTFWQASGQIRLFEGQVPNASGGSLREWDSDRWEVFAPFAAGQGIDHAGTYTTIAGSGGYALLHGHLRGVSGPGDPTSSTFTGDPGDLACPTPDNCPPNVYLDDVTAGLSDTFPGEGIRSLVNVCTGEGADRTAIPSVDGDGKLVAAECPAALPGRDSRLISPRGAALAERVPGLISDDGSRVFFMSPNHMDEPANLLPCTGTGAGETRCPPQVYVRQRNEDGSVTVRWISRSTVAGQDVGLLSTAVFEGATPDGDKAFFRTASPLTADDPNGGAQVPGGVRTGTADPNSTDLYMYDFPDAPGADPGDGTLTRISAGPSGDGDANAFPGPIDSDRAALRAFGEDGSRVYFTTAAPIAGVPAPSSGTITTPGGTPTQSATRNLYAYDANLPHAQRWRFVAQLPASSTFGECAATGSLRQRRALGGGASQTGTNGLVIHSASPNCARASADGSFLTFFTDGRLTADDPDSVSGDVYAYDAVAHELTRISASQGGAGGSYVCVTDGLDAALGALCNADPGIGGQGTQGLVTLNLIADPADPTDRTAFFESASPLVSEDQNEVYDVYQWRNGELSLLSTGAAGAEPALYQGNDRSGTNVYISTRDRLTWEDVDSVLDVYVARVNGGFDQPIDPPTCDVLADGCQGAPAAAPVANGASSAALSGQGNVIERPKPRKCRKGQVRRRGKCVAKKQKRAKRTANKNRRAGK